MKNVWRHVLGALVMALTAGAILALGWYVAVTYSSQKAYTPDNLIRLHIIPNSDSELDQQLKLSVRDCLLRKIAPELLTQEDGESPLVRLEELLPTVDAVAREVTRSCGVSYGVHSEIGIFEFPEVVYRSGTEGITLPAGRYLALRVVLGEGKGHNWWCVIFPPLCYLDIVMGREVQSENLQIDPQTVEQLEKMDPHAIRTEVLKQVSEDPHTPTQVRFLLADLLKSGWDKLLQAISRMRGQVLLCPAP